MLKSISAAPGEFRGYGSDLQSPLIPYPRVTSIIRSLISPSFRNLVWILVVSIFCSLGFGATSKRTKRKLRRVSYTRTSVARPASPALGVVAGGPWTQPTFADSTDGDNIDGEDLDIRRSAVEAL